MLGTTDMFLLVKKTARHRRDGTRMMLDLALFFVGCVSWTISIVLFAKLVC